MKKIFSLFLVCLLCGVSSLPVYGAEFIDVVYLKNGSVVKGTIIETIPNVSIKIQTKDGSMFVYKANEIERYGKEEVKGKAYGEPEASDLMLYTAQKKSPVLGAVLSILISSTGHAYAGNWTRGLGFTAGRVGCMVMALTLGFSKETHDLGYGYSYTTTEINPLYWIGVFGQLGLGIWEAVDAVQYVEKYNQGLARKYNLKMGLLLDEKGNPFLGMSYNF